MDVDISNWLNTTTNLPSVWNQIIEESLTNRDGGFTYNYEDIIKREKDGELVYTKKYNIDLKINIQTDYNTDEETLNKALMVSQEQLDKMKKTQEALELLADLFMNTPVDIDELIESLKTGAKVQIQ